MLPHLSGSLPPGERGPSTERLVCVIPHLTVTLLCENHHPTGIGAGGSADTDCDLFDWLLSQRCVARHATRPMIVGANRAEGGLSMLITSPTRRLSTGSLSESVIKVSI